MNQFLSKQWGLPQAASKRQLLINKIIANLKRGVFSKQSLFQNHHLAEVIIVTNLERIEIYSTGDCFSNVRFSIPIN